MKNPILRDMIERLESGVSASRAHVTELHQHVKTYEERIARQTLYINNAEGLLTQLLNLEASDNE